MTYVARARSRTISPHRRQAAALIAFGAVISAACILAPTPVIAQDPEPTADAREGSGAGSMSRSRIAPTLPRSLELKYSSAAISAASTAWGPTGAAGGCEGLVQPGTPSRHTATTTSRRRHADRICCSETMALTTVYSAADAAVFTPARASNSPQQGRL